MRHDVKSCLVLSGVHVSCDLYVQAYKYIQRPALLQASGAAALDVDDARQPLQIASGAATTQKGQTKQSLFPPFPQVDSCCAELQTYHVKHLLEVVADSLHLQCHNPLL